MTVLVSFDPETRVVRRFETGRPRIDMPDKLYLTHEAQVNALWGDMEMALACFRISPDDRWATSPLMGEPNAEDYINGLSTTAAAGVPVDVQQSDWPKST